MTDQNESQTVGRINGVQVIGIFIAVGVLWLATPVITVLLVTGGMQERGQAGDLFGSINALFSGLAFAGVIVAILLQREELALQRQELTLTRTELARSAAAQDETQKALNKTIYAQSFKVAMDIIEHPDIVRARGIVWNNLGTKRGDWKTWREDDKGPVDTVTRTFETVGTMIRRGILPTEYIIETWSVPIVRNWWITEFYLRDLRAVRKDPFIAKDFEWLAAQAVKFLKSKGVSRRELDEITPQE